MGQFLDDDQLYRMSRWISWSVIVITMVYKSPQVYAILRSGSSLGISMTSLLLEFYAYTIETTYQVAMKYPLESYGEIIPMWAQDILLLYVVLENRDLFHMNILPYVLLYIIGFVLVITRSLPDVVMYSLMSSTIPFLVWSKCDQLITIIKRRDPGQLSALSWGLLAYCAGARIPTQLIMAPDTPKLINTSAATVLDIAIATAIVYYNRSKTNSTGRGSASQDSSRYTGYHRRGR